MSDSLLPVLQKHPFVAGFRPEHTARLAALAKQVHFDGGQIIFHEGDAYSVFYLLGEGMVALELEMPGTVLRVQTLFAGDELDWSETWGLGRPLGEVLLEPTRIYVRECLALVERFDALHRELRCDMASRAVDAIAGVLHARH